MAKTINISKFDIKSIQINPDDYKCTIIIDNHEDINSFSFDINSIHNSSRTKEILNREVFNKAKEIL